MTAKCGQRIEGTEDITSNTAAHEAATGRFLSELQTKWGQMMYHRGSTQLPNSSERHFKRKPHHAHVKRRIHCCDEFEDSTFRTVKINKEKVFINARVTERNPAL